MFGGQDFATVVERLGEVGRIPMSYDGFLEVAGSLKLTGSSG
jgi:hypothetical protein